MFLCDYSILPRTFIPTTPFCTLKPSWYLVSGRLILTSTTGAHGTTVNFTTVWVLVFCNSLICSLSSDIHYSIQQSAWYYTSWQSIPQHLLYKLRAWLSLSWHYLFIKASFSIFYPPSQTLTLTQSTVKPSHSFNSSPSALHYLSHTFLIITLFPSPTVTLVTLPPRAIHIFIKLLASPALIFITLSTHKSVTHFRIIQFVTLKITVLSLQKLGWIMNLVGKLRPQILMTIVCSY